MKKLLFTLLACLIGVSVFAAEPGKFQFDIDYQYTLGLKQSALGSSVNRNKFEMHGNAFLLSGLYNINDKFSVGAGFGLDSFSPSPKTLPIFATFRYRPLQTLSLKDMYCFTNLGYGVLSTDNYEYAPGWLFNIGIGWQKMFRKHFGINLKIGYSLNEFRSEKHDYDDVTGSFVGSKFNVLRNSILFGFGFVI